MAKLGGVKSSLKPSRSRPIPKSIYKSTKSPDETRRKRVKFAGSADICEIKGHLEGPSFQNEVDGAKTSEFKFFKRLLEKTAQKHYSDKTVASDLNLKNDTTRYVNKASSNPTSSKYDVRRSFLSIQNVPSVAQGFLCSPAQIFEKHAEKTWTRSPRLPKVSSAARLLHSAPQTVGETDGRHSGLRDEHGGTFSGKRANLLHLAAGTRSQTVDDFLLNRSDFILEIFERLGIRRDSNKHGELQEPEQKSRVHRFPASSKRRDHIVEFDDTSQENSRLSEPQQSANLLTWDGTKIQPFQCKYSSTEACFENSLWKSSMFTEKGETFLPDFDIPASAIEFRDEFDTTEVESFHTDSHFNSAPDCKSLNKFYITRNAEIDCMKSCGTFQSDCILPNTCKFEKYLGEEALDPYINESSAGLRIALPLLERDSVEHELREHNFSVPEEVDHYPTFLHNIFGFQDEIGKSSSADVYRRRGLSTLQSCSFDIMLRGLTRPMKLDVGNYPSPTLAPLSSIYPDFHLSPGRQSDSENDIEFVGAPNDFPINITVLGQEENFNFFHDRLSY